MSDTATAIERERTALPLDRVVQLDSFCRLPRRPLASWNGPVANPPVTSATEPTTSRVGASYCSGIEPPLLLGTSMSARACRDLHARPRSGGVGIVRRAVLAIRWISPADRSSRPNPPQARDR